MPTVFRENGSRLFFYSSEGAEPKHIHVAKGDAEDKIWLEPEYKIRGNRRTLADLDEDLSLKGFLREAIGEQIISGRVA